MNCKVKRHAQEGCGRLKEDNRKIPVGMKRKLLKVVMRPAIMYGLKAVTSIKKQSRFGNS